MAEPSLTESFANVACCDMDTALAYVQRCGGDLQRALTKFFNDQQSVWDKSAPSTQPAVAPTASAKEEVSTKAFTEKEDTEALPVKKRPFAPVSDDQEENELSEKADNQVEHLDHLDPSLPWNKVQFNPSPAGAEPFAYDAIKTKVQLTKFGGPQEGSTWHWFLVADQTVFPDDDSYPSGAPALKPVTSACMKASTYINGDKFQAGWARQPEEKVGENLLRTRKGSMIESMLNQSVNSYGKNRGGCPPGYSHRWMYENSTWGAEKGDKGSSVKTSECFWDEQKNVDRWLVNVHMKWEARDKSIVPGVYVIVADQMATKMNKNQYQTSMRGLRWLIGTVGDDKAELNSRKNAILARFLTGLKVPSPTLSPKKTPPAKKQKKSPAQGELGKKAL